MKRKKIISILLVCIISFGLFLNLINAASKYYEYRWTNDVVADDNEDDFITNDIIKVDDGFVATGFYEGYLPVVRFLDKDGKTEDEIVLNDAEESHSKRIYKVDGGYLNVGIMGTVFVVTFINEETGELYTDGYESDEFGWESEIYFEDDDKYIYVISDCDEDSVIRISKDASKAIAMNEIFSKDYTDEVWAMVEKYVEIWDYDYYRNVWYYPTFVSDFNGGYVYGLNSDDDNSDDALLVYILDGKEQWVKILKNTFVRDGIQFGPNFIVAMTDIEGRTSDLIEDASMGDATEPELSAYLQMYDADGKDLGKDNIKNYMSEGEDFFYPEHLIIASKNSFFLTGSSLDYDATIGDPISADGMGGVQDAHDPKYERPDNSKNPNGNLPPKPADGAQPPAKPEGDAAMGRLPDTPDGDTSPFVAEILYFSIIHKVETKTDGNGTIEATKVNANWGEEIKFTVTPKAGFVLSAVKVTDSEGNVVIFTDNTFTMPNADVIIEATFKVENPETLAFIGIVVFIGLAISGTMLYKNRKSPSKYDEV